MFLSKKLSMLVFMMILTGIVEAGERSWDSPRGSVPFEPASFREIFVPNFCLGGGCAIVYNVLAASERLGFPTAARQAIPGVLILSVVLIESKFVDMFQDLKK